MNDRAKVIGNISATIVQTLFRILPAFPNELTYCETIKRFKDLLSFISIFITNTEIGAKNSRDR